MKSFVCFDMRRDYRHLIRKFPGMKVVRAHEIRFNPLQPPPGVDPKKWLQIFVDAFCHVFGLMEGSGDFLTSVVDELYQVYGVYDGGNTYPTIQDLLTLMRSKRYERDFMFGPNRDYLQRNMDRLAMLQATVGDMLDVAQGFDLRKLTESQVVIELEYLAESVQIYLIVMILYWTYYYRMYNRDKAPLVSCYFIIDEARKIFSAKHERGLTHSDMSILVSRSSEFKMFFLVADQIPTELSKALIANTSIKITFNLGSADDIRLFAQSCNFTREQTEAISQLQRWQAIVSKAGCPSPFVIDIPLLDVRKDVSDAEVERHGRPFLESLAQDVKPADHTIIEDYFKQQRENRGPTREEDAFLECVAKNPCLPVTAVYQRLGLSNQKGTDLVNRLGLRGMAKKVEVNTGRRGGLLKLIEITAKGAERLKQLGVKTHHLNKSPAHWFWQQQIRGYWQSVEGCVVHVEARLGSSQVDVLVERGGELLAIEVAMSPEYEETNVRKDLEAGCTGVIVACENMIIWRNVQKKIPADLKEKVAFCLVQKYFVGIDGLQEDQAGTVHQDRA